MKTNTRNSFWAIDLQAIKDAKVKGDSSFSSLLRSKTKQYEQNPDFLVSLMEIVGTQAFFFQLPQCILSSSTYMKLAVLADSKVLQFIPEDKLSEDILLQALEGNKVNNLFLIPHVTKKLTFSLCHLALKKTPEVCLLTYFKTEPKIDLSREERQILYAQLIMTFKQLGQILPPYLTKYEGIADKLTPESLDKMVDILMMKDRLSIHLPEKNLKEAQRVKI